jgi:hypothetical protein
METEMIVRIITWIVVAAFVVAGVVLALKKMGVV